MQMFFDNTCVICSSDKLIFQKKKGMLGLTVTSIFSCENCGSIFTEDELKWKLIQIKDRRNPIWMQYQKKSFYVREWIGIGAAYKRFGNLVNSLA